MTVAQNHELHGGTWLHQLPLANMECPGVLPIGGPIAQPHLDGAAESWPKSLPQLAENAGIRVLWALRRPRPPNDYGTVAVSRTVSCCTGSNCKMEQRHCHNPASWAAERLLLGATHGCGSLHTCRRTMQQNQPRALHVLDPGDSVQENALLLQHGLQWMGHKISVSKIGAEHFDALFVGQETVTLAKLWALGSTCCAILLKSVTDDWTVAGSVPDLSLGDVPHG